MWDLGSHTRVVEWRVARDVARERVRLDQGDESGALGGEVGRVGVSTVNGGCAAKVAEPGIVSMAHLSRAGLNL